MTAGTSLILRKPALIERRYSRNRNPLFRSFATPSAEQGRRDSRRLEPRGGGFGDNAARRSSI